MCELTYFESQVCQGDVSADTKFVRVCQEIRPRDTEKEANHVHYESDI